MSHSSMLTCSHDIKLDISHWSETENALETKWRVSGVVQLPWKPLLAAAGGTTHVFSKVQALWLRFPGHSASKCQRAEVPLASLLAELVLLLTHASSELSRRQGESASTSSHGM